mgnify:CR=1 FL=1
MGSFSIWHWLIVLAVVVLIFGTKRLRNIGQDLGEAVKGFKKGMHDDERPPQQLRDRSWWTGADVFVVVDDYDLVVTSSGSRAAAGSWVMSTSVKGRSMVVRRRLRPAQGPQPGRV